MFNYTFMKDVISIALNDVYQSRFFFKLMNGVFLSGHFHTKSTQMKFTNQSTCNFEKINLSI